MIALPVFCQIYFENIQKENMGGRGGAVNRMYNSKSDTRFNINAKTQGLEKVADQIIDSFITFQDASCESSRIETLFAYSVIQQLRL